MIGSDKNVIFFPSVGVVVVSPMVCETNYNILYFQVIHRDIKPENLLLDMKGTVEYCTVPAKYVPKCLKIGTTEYI